jgi:hypothetical protein
MYQNHTSKKQTPCSSSILDATAAPTSSKLMRIATNTKRLWEVNETKILYTTQLGRYEALAYDQDSQMLSFCSQILT